MKRNLKLDLGFVTRVELGILIACPFLTVEDDK